MAQRAPLPLSLCLAVAGAVFAQEPAAHREPPPIRKWRYDEDYSYLRRDAPGAWWEAFKFLPHGDGDVHATFGAEVRVRYEGYTNDLWGGAPVDDHDYVWLRALPYADLHVGEHFRVFAQLISAFEVDDEAGRSPIDEDRIDLLQAFADVAMPLGAGSVTLRGGRQVLGYGSERLISARYGPNVLQAFDLAKVVHEDKGWRLDLLYGRPVDHEPGGFDDATSDTETLWSAYNTVASQVRIFDASEYGLVANIRDNMNALVNRAVGGDAAADAAIGQVMMQLNLQRTGSVQNDSIAALIAIGNMTAAQIQAFVTAMQGRQVDLSRPVS